MNCSLQFWTLQPISCLCSQRVSVKIPELRVCPIIHEFAYFVGCIVCVVTLGYILTPDKKKKKIKIPVFKKKCSQLKTVWLTSAGKTQSFSSENFHFGFIQSKSNSSALVPVAFEDHTRWSQLYINIDYIFCQCKLSLFGGCTDISFQNLYQSLKWQINY